MVKCLGLCALVGELGEPLLVQVHHSKRGFARARDALVDVAHVYALSFRGQLLSTHDDVFLINLKRRVVLLSMISRQSLTDSNFLLGVSLFDAAFR